MIKDKYGNTLSSIYLDHRKRKALRVTMNSKLSSTYKQVIRRSTDIISKDINFSKLLGTGDWGNVYSGNLRDNSSFHFAMKLSKITKEDLDSLYSRSGVSWHEVIFLQEVIKPIIENGICPNLPLILGTFVYDKYKLILRDKKCMYPCVVILTELANGDLGDFLKYQNPVDNEIYSALFQIMAGLHAIQTHGQILNNDIKASNILFYKVDSGGYWHYVIDGIDFYVPNYGKLFIINDFGVSKSYDPNLQLYKTNKSKLCSLGSRFAINKNGTFSPIVANFEKRFGKLTDTNNINWIDRDNYNSRGCSYSFNRSTQKVSISKTDLTLDQKAFLFDKHISTNPKSFDFFSHPLVIPPFEFYNDTQDAIRVFTGGRRSTQKGVHTKYSSVGDKIVRELKYYTGTRNIDDRIFYTKSKFLLANEFIVDFFSNVKKYTIIPQGTILACYKMS